MPPTPDESSGLWIRRGQAGCASDASPSAAWPLISVVLPVRNGATTLAAAIASVAGQTWRDLELIVVDGQSSDDTVSVIRSMEDRIDAWVSEPDRGVYDAMNKGLAAARGQWIYFLGCDDVLFDVLHQVAPCLQDSNTVYYGEVQCRSGKRMASPASARELARHNVCQQALFYPRSVFDRYVHDLRYPVAADHHLNLRIFTDPAFRSCRLPLTITLYNDVSGLSSTRPDPAFAADRPALVRQHLGWAAYLELSLRAGLSRFERQHLRPWLRRLKRRRPDAGRPPP